MPGPGSGYAARRLLTDVDRCACCGRAIRFTEERVRIVHDSGEREVYALACWIRKERLEREEELIFSRRPDPLTWA